MTTVHLSIPWGTSCWHSSFGNSRWSCYKRCAGFCLAHYIFWVVVLYEYDFSEYFLPSVAGLFIHILASLMELKFLLLIKFSCSILSFMDPVSGFEQATVKSGMIWTFLLCCLWGFQVLDLCPQRNRTSSREPHSDRHAHRD